jgi:hypothetical protein
VNHPPRPPGPAEPPLRVKDSTVPKIVVKPSTMPKLDPAEVARALGATPTPAAVGGPKGPITLFAVRQELYRRLQSSGGRPGLPDADKVAKVPVSAAQWKRLEEMAEAVARPGFSPSAGQVANVLLAWALDSLGPDAVKDLVAKDSREPGA